MARHSIAFHGATGMGSTEHSIHAIAVDYVVVELVDLVDAFAVKISAEMVHLNWLSFVD